MRCTAFTALMLVFLAFCLASGCDAFAKDLELASPNGAVRLSISTNAQALSWSAEFQRRPLFRDCRFGLELVNRGEIVQRATLSGQRRTARNEPVVIPFGKAERTYDRYRELRLEMRSPSGERFELVLRCYNDAIAFRYELSRDFGPTINISDEKSSFRVEGNPTAYVQVLENYRTSHEHNVTTTTFDQIRAGDLLDLPLTLTWANGITAAITEASLRRYAGMCVSRNDEATPTLISRLTPRADGTKVLTDAPLQSPWRVVLLAARPGALLESSTIFCLNEPSKIRDLSWIRPGKITFPWWNGDVYDGRRGEPILSFEMARKYIDFCAKNGIPTHSMTSTEDTVTPWYYQTKPGVEPGPDTDVTRVRPDFDLPRIRDYATAQGVRLWTWVHNGALKGRVEEAFAAFERLGWCGMMVDFFDHDDQETVEFVESILDAAARHHIMIHLHGVWKPTGLERTYPNLMNHEGALNLEYLKWSDRCTPEHDLMMTATRLIAGPMDYHLGGFRAVPRSTFKPQNIAPHVLGTRGHMLAMYVCFDNPNPMIADYPLAYENQPGFDFLMLVPTWWDETRVLESETGEYLVTARRKGRIWYLGCLSARHTRTVDLPLNFLRAGKYAVRLWRDGDDAGADPNHLTVEDQRLSSADRLQVRVAPDGGFVAEIAPVTD